MDNFGPIFLDLHLQQKLKRPKRVPDVVKLDTP